MIGVRIDQALTDNMVERALGVCADQFLEGDFRKMNQNLIKGDYYSEFKQCLATEVAEYLGQVDKTVKAIFHYRPKVDGPAAPEESNTSAHPLHGVNLVVWVERKSAALNALVETLESVMTLSLQKIGILENEFFILDARLVDDRDIQTGRSFALLVENSTLESSLAWRRADVPNPRLTEAHPLAPQPIYELPESFDPLLIPESRLLEHAFAIERIPPEDRIELEPHFTELKVVLIRRMISDQLDYISVAKRWFNISDLAAIYNRRIGLGRIGGKAAGMLLAARILDQVADDELRESISVPESYFLGSELIYIFMSMNGLMYWNDQKYKPEDQIREEYPIIQEEFQEGSFPPEILQALRNLLENVGNKPLIVRSSSQLEDNFGTSFAGKYDSFFCPNQSTPEENLAALTNAIARTYASTLKPEALLYRRSKGLQDYDERMAVMIQVVQGDRFGDYFLPHASGVAFSQNIYRWSPQIRREDGFTRLVWGLGTRAVQRLGDDYPRLVALSHPSLQPDDSTEAIRHYSQHFVDLLDLKNNQMVTLPIHEVLDPNYPALNLISQIERDGFFVTPRMRLTEDEIPRVAINFQEFLKRTKFSEKLSNILNTIEKHYHSAVDLEYTAHIIDPRALNPKIQISLLQCRPQSYLGEVQPPPVPENLIDDDILFSTRFMIPRGYLGNIRYILFINPTAYFSLETTAARNTISQAVSRLNAKLEEKTFICIGPGRWGSMNLDLGVYVSYADIHHSSALVELSGKEIGTGPEPSLGTHFFQDLMEAGIYPLAVPLDDEGSTFNREFFAQAPNMIGQYIDVDQQIENCVRLIEINAYRPGFHLEVIMDDDLNLAIAFLSN